MSEVVGKGGVIVDEGDVAGLAAAALRAACMDRREVRRLAVSRFSLDKMIDRYEELYRLCIAGQDSPATEVDFPSIELPASDRVLPLETK